MRPLSTSFLASAVLTSALLTGCLPAYNGSNPNDGGPKPDLTEATVTPPDLSGDMTPPPVLVDMMSTGALSIMLDHTTSSLRLNESTVVDVTINANGQTGTATLSLADAPAGVTATFNPPTVTLGSSPVTSVMTVQASSYMDIVSNVATNVTATVGSDASTTTYGVSIIPKLVIRIPKGTGVNATNHVNKGFPNMVPVKVGVNGGSLKVDFYNDDDSDHEIHADGNSLGMAHEQGTLVKDDGDVTNNGVDTGNTYYETTMTTSAAATAQIYCHLHGGTATTDPGTIVVK